jgi:hypothetical protein
MKKPELVVSLTSFPAAVTYAAGAVRSILAGSLLPDRVVLYLAEPQFPGRVVPDELAVLAAANPLFEVRWCAEDIRSYKKLVPALADFPDAVIVTVDDDVRYDRNMLRDLVNMHKKFPDAILAHRAKRMKPGAPYREWKKYRWYDFVFKRLRFDFRTMQTGVGGVLYPPRSLDPEMIRPELFMSIAPTTDDVWFWAAGVARGTYVVPFPFGRHNKPRGLHKPRELSLKTVNVKSGEDRNAAALKAIVEKYPIVGERTASPRKTKTLVKCLKS